MATHSATRSVSAAASRSSTAVTPTRRRSTTALAIREQRVLGHLAEPAAELRVGKRREQRGVGHDADRLVEGTDEVLALGEVHCGLAADRGVDLGEQRGRHLHERDAAVVHGGREPDGVADDAAPERHDEVAAQQSPAASSPHSAPTVVSDFATSPSPMVTIHGSPPITSRSLSRSSRTSRTCCWDTTTVRRYGASSGPSASRAPAADHHVVRRLDARPSRGASLQLLEHSTGHDVRIETVRVDDHVRRGLVRGRAQRRQPLERVDGRHPGEERTAGSVADTRRELARSRSQPHDEPRGTHRARDSPRRGLRRLHTR